MKKILAVLVFTALTPAAFAEGSSVAVDGMAPVNGSFTLRRTVVQYGDLNINEKQGAATLLERINVAADTVCRPSHQMGAVESLVARCRSRAIHDAVTAVDSAELSAAAK